MLNARVSRTSDRFAAEEIDEVSRLVSIRARRILGSPGRHTSRDGDAPCVLRHAGCEAAALEALRLIEVEYEPLRAFIEAKESLEPCTPDEQIHVHARNGTNIHKTARLHFGDPEGRIAASTARAAVHCKFAGVSHGFTEPHATIAVWNPDDTLTVISATQVPHYLHRTLAKVLGLGMHQVHVKKPTLGGGFGGFGGGGFGGGGGGSSGGW